jgi:hypothetical protein
MTKRTIEIEDTLDEIIESVKDDIKDLAVEWIKENNEKPDLYNDLDYDGSFHEIVDGSVPIYTSEINDLFYLYGNEFEEAFENAGIGDKDDEHWPSGWKAAAIYCYIEQEVSEWFNDNIEDIYDENHKEEIEESESAPESVPEVP